VRAQLLQQLLLVQTLRVRRQDGLDDRFERIRIHDRALGWNENCNASGSIVMHPHRSARSLAPSTRASHANAACTRV
jgi:hypothetical protein